MRTETSPTYRVDIYISGPLQEIEQACRQDCLEEGLCVTVTPTRFIYTGGEESGACIGLLNYPRFPASKALIYVRAKALALRVLKATCQHSVLVVAPDQSEWITIREGDSAASQDSLAESSRERERERTTANKLNERRRSNANEPAVNSSLGKRVSTPITAEQIKAFFAKYTAEQIWQWGLDKWPSLWEAIRQEEELEEPKK